MCSPTISNSMNDGNLNRLSQRAAIIDIGSNSIRYMESVCSDGVLSFSQKEVYTTRLAEGLLASGMLSQSRMQQSLSVLSALALRAKAGGFTPNAYATSAVRDAKNRSSFLEQVYQQTGLRVHVLSGEEEANFAYLGASGGVGGLIDIGGGSTQIMTANYRKSFPLGCVRIKDLCGGLPYADICTKMQPLFRETYALPAICEKKWSAVGGTATTLAALHLGLEKYDPDPVNTCTMQAEEIHALLSRLDAMGDACRRKHPLLLERHDVILCGGAILAYLIALLGIERISFRDTDGMEGYCAGFVFPNVSL